MFGLKSLWPLNVFTCAASCDTLFVCSHIAPQRRVRVFATAERHDRLATCTSERERMCRNGGQAKLPQICWNLFSKDLPERVQHMWEFVYVV